MNEINQPVRLRLFGIPRLKPFLMPYRRRILLMVLMGTMVSAIDALYPLFNRYALNHFVGEKTLDTLPLFAAGYLLVLAVQAVLNYRSAFACSRLELFMNRDLRNAAFHHLQTLSLSYYNQNAVGYIHARLMSDTGLIGDLVSWRMMNLVWNGAYILGIFVVMLTINIKLTGLILLLLPIAAALMTFFQRKLLIYNRKIREINSRITANYNEGIIGLRTIKVLDAQDRIRQDFEKETLSMRHTSIREARISALFISSITLFSALVLSLVLWKGGSLTRESLMRIGTLSVFMSYALSLLEPIQGIIETMAAFVAIQVNIERLTRLLDEKSEVADAPEVTDIYGDVFHPKKENWEELTGDVEFRDVSFHYPDGEEYVLSHFNLKVPHGQNVAIVGETGAGKSTLVNLVCRFFEPTDGTVLIDGKDARDRSLLWLHSNIGYVLQTPHLFSGTIRDNVRYGKPDASDEEILRAMQVVSADRILEKMDKGLDTDLGEGGALLSTGEKQLLSFARAILADPRILILDEATSSIDSVTEKAIQDAIAALTKGRTSFIIAHRLSTIVNADVILVVHDGIIVEQGTHEELMKQKGEYYHLYRRQYDELSWDT